MRVPNSGAASPRDVDLGWEQLQEAALQMLILERNTRPDGRGLSDSRELHCEVGTSQLHPHDLSQKRSVMLLRKAALSYVLVLREAMKSGKQYQMCQ